jgi:uncharacterized protein (DUF2147 family)
MKTIYAALGLGLACLPVSAAQALADANPAMGLWARGDGIAEVKVAPCGDNLCATNTWIKSGVTNEKVGDVLVMTVKPESGSSFRGEAFDPQRNMRFKMTLDVKGDSMTTRGCVLGGILCKSVSWSRID